MSGRDATKVLVGVGVVAAVGLATAVGVAYWLQEAEEKRRTHAASRPVKIEVVIPANQAGIVIGRRGENIQEIQRKTQCKINFKDELSTATERFLTITGPAENAQLAEILIHQTIANQPRLETVIMEIPATSVGRVIGTGGQNIRSLQGQSHCKIDIAKGGYSNEGWQKVTLRGTSEQVAQAKRMLEETVQQDSKMNEKIRVCTESRPPRLAYKQPLFLTAEGTEDSSRLNTINPASKSSYESLTSAAAFKTMGVYVSAVVDPGHFFVQKVGPRSVELDKLTQEMTSYYEKKVNQELNAPDEVSKGDLVAAQFTGDGQFYRAKVVDILADEYDENKIELNLDFIDFGDQGTKPKDEVFDLRMEFLKLNFQAIACSMANIKPSGENWTPEASDDFEALTHASQWKEMLAEVFEYKTEDVPNGKDDQTSNAEEESEQLQVPCVNLIYSTAEKDISIADELVKRGHAVFISGQEPQYSKSEAGGKDPSPSYDG